MTEGECLEFLREVLPRMGLRWTGFHGLHGQVCKRLRKHLAALGIPDLAAYRARLEADPAEWAALDALCVVTISRFFRDAATWKALENEVLPALARAAGDAGESVLRCWSIGCASGEEPYTLAIVWALGVAPAFPGISLRILATDLDERVLARAREGTYEAGSLRELPAAWRNEAFTEESGLFTLRERFREPVELRRSDLRTELPDERFRLILCRNVVLTYVDDARQAAVLSSLLERLEPGGAFVVGARERRITDLPLEPRGAPGVYRRR